MRICNNFLKKKRNLWDICLSATRNILSEKSQVQKVSCLGLVKAGVGRPQGKKGVAIKV